MTVALPWIVGAALLVVVLGWLRLLRTHARQPLPRGRLWLLLAAQPVLAALLYPVLLPPPRLQDGGPLHVATAGTQAAQLGQATQWVALPEAPRLPGVARMPDLATALRRAPGTTTVIVHGDGLPARDRDALRVPVRVQPSPAPAGLVAAWAPPSVAPGEALTIAAQVQGLPGAQVELLDPAGQRVDRAPPDAHGQVRLRGLARAPGQVLFDLRLRDAAGAERGHLAVPVQVVPVPPVRLLLLAGAPQPEVKYLRRWASDAGLTVRSQVTVSAGLQLGDTASLDAASLDQLDVLVLDTRRLLGLSAAQRQLLGAAIARGLGVLVRVTGPVDAATRSALAALGLPVSGGDTSTAVTVAAAPADAGIEPDTGSTTTDTALPPLQRRTLQPQVQDAIVAARANDGTALGWWRSAGRGRIGVSVVDDSYALVLAGRSDLHAQLWAQLLGAVTRPGAALPAPVQDGWVQQRMTLCDVGADAHVIAPDGGRHPLLPERSGSAPPCAGYWPAATGWHRLQTGTTQRWLFVRAPTDAPALYRQQLREATAALAASGSSAATPTAHPGARWPWLLAWLTVAAGLWWLERRRT
ncbi:carboxypeptidase regulatory-like domain-containing protein [Xanthomonas campestris pv. raphani]|uniref:carboxypeptidase regulatory-like domain-containing protein n=1 Tax=Xanthomonas campestris TaxID=339 RepID=UPI002B23B914|nr:carboxypeptidase regulatory-like domain-containing protein [Xanthomonas campestris]MEA9914495.1 carboxypeptidase regulatory-like domain-containing protein [Xanthomonas campestris pv. raphani]